jgi:thiamine-phosphate pyrophosphorylase
MVLLPMQPVYAILDGRVLTARGIALAAAAAALLDGGLRLLQIRWKESWNHDVYAEAVQVADLCQRAGATLVINDRADVARLLGAGVHVGQSDLQPADVRRIAGPNCLVGYSTHNEEQFRAALSEPVDYVALGPVYGTASKDNPDPVVGLAQLARLRTVSVRPVVAIGGITLERAAEVWRAGADSIAVIGDLYPAGCTPASIRSRASEWMSTAADEHCRR